MNKIILIALILIPFCKGVAQGYLFRIIEEDSRINHMIYEQFIFIDSLKLYEIAEFEEFEEINNAFPAFQEGKLDYFIYNPVSYNLILNKGRRISSDGLSALYCCEYGSTSGLILKEEANDQMRLNYSQVSIRLIDYEPSISFQVKMKKPKQKYFLTISVSKVHIESCECYGPNDKKHKKIQYSYPRFIGEYYLLSELEIVHVETFLDEVGSLFRKCKITVVPKDSD